MLRFLAPLLGVAVSDIEVVFGRENVNKQLRIHAPKKLPAAMVAAGLTGPGQSTRGRTVIELA